MSAVRPHRCVVCAEMSNSQPPALQLDRVYLKVQTDRVKDFGQKFPPGSLLENFSNLCLRSPVGLENPWRAMNTPSHLPEKPNHIPCFGFFELPARLNQSDGSPQGKFNGLLVMLLWGGGISTCVSFCALALVQAPAFVVTAWSRAGVVIAVFAVLGIILAYRLALKADKRLEVPHPARLDHWDPGTATQTTGTASSPSFVSPNQPSRNNSTLTRLATLLTDVCDPQDSMKN